MGTAKVQREPVAKGKTVRRFHYLGQRNQCSQVYMTRNCIFEPGLMGKNWQGSCLTDIERAFRWRKPAIVSTHRVNFIGALEEENRKNGLRELDGLLAQILQKWPNVEFMTTRELGELIASDHT